MAENPATALFREYLRIDSGHPNPDYESCRRLVAREAASMELPCKVVECFPGKPIVIVTWTGLEPDLPSILLNSHTDVVPVFPNRWIHPPFSAFKDRNGDIYASGAQDMKSIGIQYLEAVRRLKASGRRLKRTVHLTFVPDEEIGGKEGMGAFVKTQQFKALNVGFCLDEGGAAIGEMVPVYYGERAHFWLTVVCQGTPGHGARFLPDTPGQKAQFMINKLLELREKERQRMEANPALRLGDVATVNLTMLEGGVLVNVVPDQFRLTFDVRIPPTLNAQEFESQLRKWMDEAGSGVQLEYIDKFTDQSLTSVDPSNPWWRAFSEACMRRGLKICPLISPGISDSRFLREVGVPALGMSPTPGTANRMHSNNEFLNEATFLRGIDIYTEIIASLAQV